MIQSHFLVYAVIQFGPGLFILFLDIFQKILPGLKAFFFNGGLPFYFKRPLFHALHFLLKSYLLLFKVCEPGPYLFLFFFEPAFLLLLHSHFPCKGFNAGLLFVDIFSQVKVAFPTH